MATSTSFTGGIQVPVQPSGTGGLRLLDADAYIEQTVRVLCGDGDSDNPFNDGVGVGASAVFANASDTAWRSKTRNEIQEVFKDLQRANLAKLIGLELAPSRDVPEEYEARVKFLSIETNTILEVETPLRRG